MLIFGGATIGLFVIGGFVTALAETRGLIVADKRRAKGRRRLPPRV